MRTTCICLFLTAFPQSQTKKPRVNVGSGYRARNDFQNSRWRHLHRCRLSPSPQGDRPLGRYGGGVGRGVSAVVYERQFLWCGLCGCANWRIGSLRGLMCWNLGLGQVLSHLLSPSHFLFLYVFVFLSLSYCCLFSPLLFPLSLFLSPPFSIFSHFFISLNLVFPPTVNFFGRWFHFYLELTFSRLALELFIDKKKISINILSIVPYVESDKTR